VNDVKLESPGPLGLAPGVSIRGAHNAPPLEENRQTAALNFKGYVLRTLLVEARKVRAYVGLRLARGFRFLRRVTASFARCSQASAI
jgi:hypothetical protein